MQTDRFHPFFSPLFYAIAIEALLIIAKLQGLISKPTHLWFSLAVIALLLLWLCIYAYAKLRLPTPTGNTGKVEHRPVATRRPGDHPDLHR